MEIASKYNSIYKLDAGKNRELSLNAFYDRPIPVESAVNCINRFNLAYFVLEEANWDEMLLIQSNSLRRLEIVNLINIQQKEYNSLLDNNANLEIFLLSSIALGSYDLVLLSESLVNHTSLQKITIEVPTCTASLEQLAHYLNRNSIIKYINLFIRNIINGGDNHGIKNITLETLKLGSKYNDTSTIIESQWNSISNLKRIKLYSLKQEGILMNSIINFHTSVKKITLYIDYHCRDFNMAIEKLISMNILTLTSFKLVYEPYTLLPEFVDAIIEALKVNNTLTNLYSPSDIAKQFIKLNHPSIKSLIVQARDFYYDEFLVDNTSLEHVEIRSQLHSLDSAAQSFFKVIQSNTHLKSYKYNKNSIKTNRQSDYEKAQLTNYYKTHPNPILPHNLKFYNNWGFNIWSLIKQ
ncbi:hypothetical protein DLAC_01266 [Tieghemostelium lacteum]|uniref:Uncharacterized protein n=1 Tax=Tieghemostelium lacteum TaxID=361077 RepID=A0A152A887_TIELA|nr:hypothetical protein DLAC_01266 [Tieghemostelium lacteum]|eukprot:KYR02426.1 hypothetical protein DLAC_01266 [Tieghemostelium lacteum]